MSELYEKVEKFVEDSFADKKFSHTPNHLKDTAESVLLLKPDADEALLIAALVHDIDRAYQDRTVKEDGFNGPKYLKSHQESSANIIKDFLVTNGADKSFVGRVWFLVSKHEEGGDRDQNLLMDADSLSFFRNKNYIEIKNKYGFVNLKDKIDWMYERMSSKEAKDLARPMYEEALKTLGLDE